MAASERVSVRACKRCIFNLAQCTRLGMKKKMSRRKRGGSQGEERERE